MTPTVSDAELDELLKWARTDVRIFTATIEKFPSNHFCPRPGEHYPDGTDEPLEWQLERTQKIVSALSELRWLRDQIEARCHRVIEPSRPSHGSR